MSSAVTDYISALQGPDKDVLLNILMLVQNLVPTATQATSYGIPAFRYKDMYLVGLQATKHHLSLYPGSKVIDHLHTKLVGFETTKGTIKFTAEKPLSDDLLTQIITFCVSEIDAKTS